MIAEKLNTRAELIRILKIHGTAGKSMAARFCEYGWFDSGAASDILSVFLSPF